MTSQKLIPYVGDNGKSHDNFYVDPSTDTIYFKKGHAGQKIKFSTKISSDNFIKAKRWANQEFNRRIGKSKVLTPRTLIKDELKLWLAVKSSEGLAYDTMNNVKRAKEQIEEFWGGKWPHEITRDTLALWYAHWASEHPTIDMENAIKYFRNFCRYLSQKVVDGRPLLPAIPSMKDPNAKKIRQRRTKAKEHLISAADFKKILATAENSTHRLLVMIMYTMATRVTETLTMTWNKEVVMVDGEWTYRWSEGQNKAGLTGWHVFHPAVVEDLDHCLRYGIRGPRLFPQSWDQTKALREQQIDWAAWRKRAALPYHWTPHTFRHTCLSNLFNDPANPQALICKLYRVSLAVAMEHYIKPTDEGRGRMARAIKVEL